MESEDKKKRNEKKKGGSSSGKNIYIILSTKALPIFIMVLKIVPFEI